VNEVRRSFRMARSASGVLTGLTPLRNRLFRETGLGVVMGQQLRLGLGGIAEALGQRARETGVILLPDRCEQRLIRGVLDQRVLERETGFRNETSLVEQPRIHQPDEIAPDKLLAEQGDGEEPVVAE